MDIVLEALKWSAMDTNQKLVLGGFLGFSALSVGGYVVSAIKGTMKGSSSDDTTKTPAHGGGGGRKLGTSGDKSKLFEAFKWLHCPVATVAFLINFANDEQFFLDKIPAVFSNYGTTIKNAMDLHPTDVLQSFKLGSIYEQLVDTTTGAVRAGLSADKIEELQKMASSAVGLDRLVSIQEIANLPKVLADMTSASGGSGSRILSMFSLVNFIWLISILGLTATVGPFLWIMGKPIRKLLFRIWDSIVWPTLVALKPFYQYLIYGLACLIIVESKRYPTDDVYSMTGTFVGITGLAGIALGWAWTTATNSSGGGDLRTYQAMCALFACGAFVPVAKLHQSSLIGDFAAGAIFSLFLVSDVCDAIFSPFYRYGRNRVWYSVLGTSLWITMGNAACKVYFPENQWIAPLQHGAAIVGSLVLFINTLCHPFFSYSYRADPLIPNLIFIGNAAAHYYLGILLNLPGMSNLAVFFSGLYFCGKYIEYCPKGGASVVVSTFAGFGLLYALSLQLSSRPEIMISLFSFGTK